MFKTICTLLFALIATGCGTMSLVRFEADGLHHNKADLTLRFRDPASGFIIDSKWGIENWSRRARMISAQTPNGEWGYTQAPFAASDLRRKRGATYEGILRVDMDNDGQVEDYESFFTDLELRQNEHEGEIWVLSRELPKHRARVLLDVMLTDYAESLAFEGSVLRRSPYDYWTRETRAYASRIVSKEPVTLGPYEGIIGTIELANLAQLELDKNHRAGLIRVLFVRLSAYESKFEPEYLVGQSTSARNGKGLLMVGYYNSPQYFEQGLKDFHAFLGQFAVAGKPAPLVRTGAAPVPQEPMATTPTPNAGDTAPVN